MEVLTRHLTVTVRRTDDVPTVIRVTALVWSVVEEGEFIGGAHPSPVRSILILIMSSLM